MLNYNNIDSDFDGSVAFQDLLGVNASDIVFQPGGIAREHTGASRNQDIIIKGFTHIHRTFLKNDYYYINGLENYLRSSHTLDSVHGGVEK